MPIYEYRCHSCGNQVDVFVRSSTAPPLCPGCGAPLTDKLFSVPNLLSGRSRHRQMHACCGQDEGCDSGPCSEGGPCCQDL
jgi:putative FmdB family regulatory protein